MSGRVNEEMIMKTAIIGESRHIGDLPGATFIVSKIGKY
jgi:hypothetical protein